MPVVTIAQENPCAASAEVLDHPARQGGEVGAERQMGDSRIQGRVAGVGGEIHAHRLHARSDERVDLTARHRRRDDVVLGNGLVGDRDRAAGRLRQVRVVDIDVVDRERARVRRRGRVGQVQYAGAARHDQLAAERRRAAPAGGKQAEGPGNAESRDGPSIARSEGDAGCLARPDGDRYNRRRSSGDDGVVGARGPAFSAHSAFGARGASGAAASGASGIARDACGAVCCAAAAASPRRIDVTARYDEERGET